MSQTEPKKPGKGCAWFLVALIVAGVAWGVFSEVGGAAPPDPGKFHNADTTSYSDGTRYGGGLLPAFSPAAQEELTQGLAELEKAYGICFGWSLEDGSTKKVQLGSSRGPGVAANTCPRWLETRVAVGYSTDSSESPDGVRVSAAGSPEFTKLPREDDFARLGVNGPALVEDPVGGTGHAALGLPLLMVESGALQAVPTPPPADRPTPRPLGRAGSSDFPLSTTLTLSGLGVGIVVCVVLGFWMRSRARKKNAGSAPAGPQPGQQPPGYPPRSGQQGQPPQPGQQSQPGQPGHSTQPGHQGQPGQPQPGHPGHQGQPSQPGQQGQPGQPGQSGQPGQPGQATQPGHSGQSPQSGQPSPPGQSGQPGHAGQQPGWGGQAYPQQPPYPPHPQQPWPPSGR
ncbi:hypothetical protein [Amycolatopsis albispora]|uniref:Collagen-like protein n=1 Tax=Amycolatopsis albispora TaxID=1804986 RepID=A0A344L619_9PSEU|nr:hypothetical protein [Amycolatopsis albispora]AXB43493.1 hypothetical protein A4R43_13850 [Amycolatopsis albispora]